MRTEEASALERLLRDLCAELDPQLIAELDTMGFHTADAGPASATTSDRGDDTSAAGGVDEPYWCAPGVGPGEPAPRASEVSDPGPEVTTLLAALDAVAAQDPVSLSGPTALARTRALLQSVERLRALACEALADVGTRQLHAVDDSPSLTSWVNGLSVPGVDGRDITLSRRLRQVPQIREELQAGRMSGRTASTLTTAVVRARPFLDRPNGLIDGLDAEPVLQGVLVDGVVSLLAEQIGGAADAGVRLSRLRDELQELNDPARAQLARWEAALVVFARECDPALLSSGIGMLVDALLPNEHDKRARQAEDDRGLDLHRNPLGAGWRVKGDLDDETGELLATVLDAAAATDPAAPEDTRRHADGQQALDDETLPPHQWPVDQPAPRSHRQQRHDAFKRGLQALLDHGVLGVRSKALPHVAVTVSLDFVDGLPGSLPARTDHDARLSREQVQRMLCRSTFTRLVLDARHRVVEVSHTQRTSTALERLILKVQGGAVCLGAGCARGPATGHRLIPHHGSLFSNTRTTQLDDIALLCEVDHDHELHSRKRHVRLKDGRVLGPEGWVRR